MATPDKPLVLPDTLNRESAAELHTLQADCTASISEQLADIPALHAAIGHDAITKLQARAALGVISQLAAKEQLPGNILDQAIAVTEAMPDPPLDMLVSMYFNAGSLGSPNAIDKLHPILAEEQELSPPKPRNMMTTSADFGRPYLMAVIECCANSGVEPDIWIHTYANEPQLQSKLVLSYHYAQARLASKDTGQPAAVTALRAALENSLAIPEPTAALLEMQYSAATLCDDAALIEATGRRYLEGLREIDLVPWHGLVVSNLQNQLLKPGHMVDPATITALDEAFEQCGAAQVTHGINTEDYRLQWDLTKLRFAGAPPERLIARIDERAHEQFLSDMPETYDRADTIGMNGLRAIAHRLGGTKDTVLAQRDGHLAGLAWLSAESKDFDDARRYLAEMTNEAIIEPTALSLIELLDQPDQLAAIKPPEHMLQENSRLQWLFDLGVMGLSGSQDQLYGTLVSTAELLQHDDYRDDVIVQRSIRYLIEKLHARSPTLSQSAAVIISERLIGSEPTQRLAEDLAATYVTDAAHLRSVYTAQQQLPLGAPKLFATARLAARISQLDTSV